MPEFNTEDHLLPGKHLVLTPFAKFAWVMIGLAVLAFGWLAYNGFDPSGQKRESAQWLEKAGLAVKEQHWDEAAAAIQKVRGQNRDHPRFLRIVADYLKGTRSDPALLARIITSLETSGAMQPDDFIWMSRDHLNNGRVEAAREALEQVSKPMRSSLDAMEAEVALLKMENQPAAAAKAEAALLASFPNDPRIILRKSLQDLDGTFPELQRAAQARLWELAEREDGHGLSALRILTQRTNLTLPEAARLRQRLEKHPLASLNDRLQALSLVMRLAPEQRTTLLDAETERHKNQPKEELMAFAAWLAKEKEFERMQRFSAGTALLNSGELFLLMAQGLAEQENWQALKDLLGENRQLPVSKARAATWRALAARNLSPDDSQQTRKQVQEAITQAKSEKNALALLGAARLAEQWDMPDLALQVYQILSEEDSVQKLDMLEKCWQMALILKNSEALLAVARQQHQLRPENPGFTQRGRYLTLLLGAEIEAILKPASEDRNAQDHETDQVLLLHALGAYRLRDSDRTRASLEKIRDATSLTAGERAVYAGLLAKTRANISRAYELAEKIRPELLLKEEQVFLQMAL
ncbi:MAG TPA: hypothetical protein DDZ88_23415 [Verrucomicrobiales bacterium]|nr:hypothetical protein [Verrucomicrobiales bacterium]